MCLWGVSPIRLIHKPKAGTTENTTRTVAFFVFSPRLWQVFHIFLLHHTIREDDGAVDVAFVVRFVGDHYDSLVQFFI